MEDATLRRAMRALAHPVSIGAVFLLVVNDQVARWHWPSWLTGKAGDAAWLFFAPLLAAIPIALVLPRRLRHRDAWAGGLAIGLVGATFAAIKTSPAAHALFGTLWRAAMGREALLLRDPTDLVTLPVLGLTWWLWRAMGRRPGRIPGRAWWVVALAALATMGNAPIPDRDDGIVCLQLRGGEIVAITAGDHGSTPVSSTFASQDGGLTWRRVEEGVTREVRCTPQERPWTLAAGGAGEVYRFTRDERIERSTDEGGTWVTEVWLRGQHVGDAYYRAMRKDSQRGPTPLHAVYDPASRNVVAAMGNDGVLVRTADGVWHWAAVGDYLFQPLERVDQAVPLILCELWLAAVVAVWGVSVLSPGPRSIRGNVYLVVVSLGWSGITVLLRPAAAGGYEVLRGLLYVLGLLVVAVPLAAYRGWHWARTSWAGLGMGIGLALGAAVLFAGPFLLWVMGVIPLYWEASWLAVALAGATLALGRRVVARR